MLTYQFESTCIHNIVLVFKNVAYNAGLRLRCTPDLNATLDNLRVFAQLVSPEFYDIFTEGLFCECSHAH